VTVVTKVTQIFEIDLGSSQVLQKGTPGGFLTYPLTLENMGNGNDIIDLQVTSLPEGWSYSFKDIEGRQIDQIELGYHEKTDIKLNIWVADNHKETEETIAIKAQSVYDLSQQDQVQLTAEIRMPDLKIQSVEFNPSRLRENKVVQIRILLQNTGTGGAEDILVEFYDNGKYISSDSISYITTGISGNATAVFTWLPKAGKHHLKFVVDPATDARPDGKVLESSEDNNILLMDKTVQGDDAIPAVSSPLVLLALLGAVFVTALARRRR
jgi:hypothetical protein